MNSKLCTCCGGAGWIFDEEEWEWKECPVCYTEGYVPTNYLGSVK